MSSWGWPQWVMVVLLMLSILSNLIRAMSESGLCRLFTLIGTAIMTPLFVWLLHCGGFW